MLHNCDRNSTVGNCYSLDDHHRRNAPPSLAKRFDTLACRQKQLVRSFAVASLAGCFISSSICLPSAESFGPFLAEFAVIQSDYQSSHPVATLLVQARFSCKIGAYSATRVYQECYQAAFQHADGQKRIGTHLRVVYPT